MLLKKSDLIVLGAGGFGQEVADIARTTGEFVVRGFVEGIDRGKCGRDLDGAPILWVEDLAGRGDGFHLVCAVGSTKRQKFIAQVAELGWPFARVVHPDTTVSPWAHIEDGVVINGRAVIGIHSRIGKHTILNRGVLIGHHCEIGAVNTISPGVNIGGHTTIGDEVFIGMGAVVFDHLKIGEKAVIAGGAVVREDVPARTMVAGVPATVKEPATT